MACHGPTLDYYTPTVEPLSLLRKQLISVLRIEILPWLESGAFETILLGAAAPKTSAGSRASVKLRSSERLQETGAGSTFLRHTHWPQSRLISRRFLYMGCVVEGPVDLFVGTSDFVLDVGTPTESQPVEAVFRLHDRTCFLVPPRVPFVDGSCPHWEQNGTIAPDSRIFWMEIAPTGVLLHLCQTQNGEHLAQSEIFVGDMKAVMLCECLLEELQANSTHAPSIARALLSAILLRIDQSLTHRRSFQPDWKGHALAGPEELQGKRDGAVAVRRACEFIQANQNEALSLEQIAQHANISATHLNRLFQSTLGVSVMKFVTQSRIKTAQVLLESTELPVTEIGRTVGFTHAAHFSRVFVQHMSLSPLEFRKRQRSQRAE